MKRKRLRPLAVLTACLLALTGCAGTSHTQQEDDSLVVISTPYPNMLTGDG